jgi:acyl-CoA reductase-like NAD-dependent aldehyde dehydrogenase
MTEKTVDAKAAKAHLADANWKETSYRQRADLLHAKNHGIKKYELAKSITKIWVNFFRSGRRNRLKC